MTQAAERRLEEIGDEVEALEEAGKWNLQHFRRLYVAALDACEGDRRRLEFFGPFMLGREYLEEERRLSRECRSAA
jgi:hypothetical protein